MKIDPIKVLAQNDLANIVAITTSKRIKVSFHENPLISSMDVYCQASSRHCGARPPRYFFSAIFLEPEAQK